MPLTPEAGERTWQRRWEDWKSRAAAKHDNLYTYPSSERKEGKISIVCAVHGLFSQAPNKHMHGQGCPKCNTNRGKDLKHDLIEKYPEWDWGQVEVPKSKAPLLLTCQEHGQFTTFHNKLMARKDGLSPCPKCNRVAGGAANRVPSSVWEERVRGVWGDKLKLVGGTEGCQDYAAFECDDHGAFKSRPADVCNGHGCPKCAPRSSRGETEIVDYLRDLGLAVDIRNREVLGGLEIDVYLPDAKLGIEHCGMYWHGDLRTPRGYHARKLSLAREAGVQLLTVFEDEWLFSTDKVMFQILNKLGYAKTIYGRSTKVVEVSWQEASEFLDTWHLQGAGVAGKLRHGLMHDGELVAVAVWGPARFERKNEGDLELYRLAFKGGVRVVGAVGKLVAAVGKPEGVKRLVTYADLRWGTGKGYESAGFQHAGDTLPGYFWCKGLRRISRHHFQKHKLKDVLPKYDESKSEAENCEANGYWRVYDCGHSKWIKEIA